MESEYLIAEEHRITNLIQNEKLLTYFIYIAYFMYFAYLPLWWRSYLLTYLLID